MGNCQAAEAAAVVIQHSGGKRVDRIYWSVSAYEIMNSNPGHYVAQIVASQAARMENGTPVKQVKLLRPNDSLVIGQVYRLISFEDVLKEFTANKCIKLGRLLKEATLQISSNTNSTSVELGSHGHGISNRGVDRRQWRPALQSIAELGS